MKPSLHVPVMVEEVVNYLCPHEGGVYVDCTLGTGGHSLALLKKTGGNIKLIGIDWDEEALTLSGERLRDYRDNVRLERANFAHLAAVLEGEGIRKVNGLLYDLGVSSLQLDNGSRGFSFLKEAPLDMRMDRRSTVTAAHIVNTLSQGELGDILWRLGEERWAKRMAIFIVEERKKSFISTTKELVEILKRAVPAKCRRGKRTHFATRSFQALRIAVNQELQNLEKSLSEAIGVLSPGGRMCVISYHSLEDTIVKRTYKQVEGKELAILTRKVVRPSFQEMRANPRSRSAKLRVAEKL